MVDLHTHSVYSDGTNTPEELLTLATACGLRAIALTDHDTVEGIPSFLEAAEKFPVEAVPGIELSAECTSGTMHILGYFFDPFDAQLNQMLEKIKEGRIARNIEILKKLNRRGYVMQWSEVKQYAGSDIVGRPHFAEALLKRGYVKSKKTAFDLLLAKGRPAYAARPHYSSEECIAKIRQAGGVAVLAHPATLHLSGKAFQNQIRQLTEQGLGGIELYYAEYRPETQQMIQNLATELDLVCTGGTDFHGANSPDLKLGTGFGQLHVPDEALDQLKAKAGSPCSTS